MVDINFLFSWLNVLQREVLRRRMLLTRLLKIAVWLVVLGYLVVWGLYASGQVKSVALLSEWGRKLGTISFVFYMLTLLPSMVRRLKFPRLLPVMSILLPFRRQFGVLMFLTAFAHQGFTTILPNLVFIDFEYSKLALQLSAHHIAGFVAWWLLFPLWLTSNDASVKYLGK